MIVLPDGSVTVAVKPAAAGTVNDEPYFTVLAGALSAPNATVSVTTEAGAAKAAGTYPKLPTPKATTSASVQSPASKLLILYIKLNSPMVN